MSTGIIFGALSDYVFLAGIVYVYHTFSFHVTEIVHVYHMFTFHVALFALWKDYGQYICREVLDCRGNCYW